MRGKLVAVKLQPKVFQCKLYKNKFLKLVNLYEKLLKHLDLVNTKISETDEPNLEKLNEEEKSAQNINARLLNHLLNTFHLISHVTLNRFDSYILQL